MTFGDSHADEPESLGAVEGARRWLGDILVRTDVRSAWRHTDPGYRLALVQAIIWLNDQNPMLTGYDKDEAARALAEDRPDHPLWDSVSGLVADEWRQELGGLQPENSTGATTRSVGPGLELVTFREKPDEAFDPPGMDVRGVLVQFRDGRWLIAGLSERRATPGWPPDLGY